jgi:hypothetical protein
MALTVAAWAHSMASAPLRSALLTRRADSVRVFTQAARSSAPKVGAESLTVVIALLANPAAAASAMTDSRVWPGFGCSSIRICGCGPDRLATDDAGGVAVER